MPKRRKEKVDKPTPQPDPPKSYLKSFFMIPILAVPIAWLAYSYQTSIPAQCRKSCISAVRIDLDATDTVGMLALESQLPIDTEYKRFAGENLIFVTPWNKEGYLYTVDYAKKIDYVSPVWYSVKFDNKLSFIHGEQDVDTIYLEQLKIANPAIKVLPRVYVEFESKEKFFSVNQEKLIQLIVDKVASKYDGILFDSPMISYQSMLGLSLNVFLKRLKESMSKDKLLFASIMGYNQELRWTGNMIKDLILAVDRLLVQTYDYPRTIGHMRPLSPKQWVKENVQYFKPYRKKIMMVFNLSMQKGLPFYGFKLEENGQVNHIMARDINKHMSIEWNEQIEECIYEDRREPKTKLFYPCNKFIKDRFDYYAKHEMGVFIWEGGQGFRQFYEHF